MDFVIKGALVCDGTGADARVTDVGVADGRIVRIGDLGDATAGEVIDADGLVLAPGFVDPHTHYDAQVMWDSDLSPSPSHGVTTVVIGNCGFGIAPTRPEHRQRIIDTLENVEGMDATSLMAGIPWDFETFPEYLDAIARRPLRIDVAAMIGHTPLRQYVMGDDSTERPATEEEIARMAELVGEALDAGAIGFATSNANGHTGADGKPVPSRFAEQAEYRALAQQLATRNHGVTMLAIGPGLFIKEAGYLAETTGRPVIWAALLSNVPGQRSAVELVEKTAQQAGPNVYPQVACRPIVMQITMADPFPFARIAGFEPVFAAPREARAEFYADKDWRASVYEGVDKQWGHQWPKVWVAESERHPELVGGPSLLELARQRGVHPFDVLCDLSLDEDLATRFQIVMFNDDEDEIGQLLRDPRTLLGLSDAGAHMSQLCDACYSTHLLGHWVRERKTLTLEQAVWRLSGQPAEIFGLHDRGRIEVGRRADLVLFDADRVAPGPLVRVWDLPGGADRLVSDGVGVTDVWVNGVAIRRGETDLADSRPGQLVRSGQ